MIQGSDEWFTARLGKVTASRVADILPGKNKTYLASRKNYMAELICERLTGSRAEGFESSAMRWGTDTEPFARAAYEATTGLAVKEVGLIDHPRIKGLAASPDGLVGDVGGLEIKCPNTATHIQVLLSGNVDRKYIIQMHVGMMCAGREWWDYVDYDPRLPGELSFFMKRFYLDKELASEIAQEVEIFNTELEHMESDLRERMAS